MQKTTFIGLSIFQVEANLVLRLNDRDIPSHPSVETPLVAISGVLQLEHGASNSSVYTWYSVFRCSTYIYNIFEKSPMIAGSTGKRDRVI